MIEQSFIEQVSFLSAQNDEDTLFPQMQFLKAFQQVEATSLALHAN